VSGLWYPGMSRNRLVSLLGNLTSRSPTTEAHLSHMGPGPYAGRPRPLPPPSVARNAAPHDLSSILTQEGTGRDRAPSKAKRRSKQKNKIWDYKKWEIEIKINKQKPKTKNFLWFPKPKTFHGIASNKQIKQKSI
jgi:hypothetical protein